MNCQIQHYTVTPRRLVAGTKGSYGFDTIEPEFSEEWEPLAKKLVFWPEGEEEPIQVIYTGTPVVIPAEVLAHSGICRYAYVGVQGNRTLISAEGELLVLDTLPPEGENSTPPTASEIAQVLTYMQASATSAATASQAAQDASDAAESAASSADSAEEEAATAASRATAAQGSAASAAASAATASANAVSAATSAQNASAVAASVRNDADRGVFNGATPTIGGNGHWYIREQDTGILAQSMPVDDSVTTQGNLWTAQNIHCKMARGYQPLSLDEKTGNGICLCDAVDSADVGGSLTFEGVTTVVNQLFETTEQVSLDMYGWNLLSTEKLESGTIDATTGALTPSNTRCRNAALVLPAGTYYWIGNVPARTHVYRTDGTWVRSLQGNTFTLATGETTVRGVWTATLAVTLTNPPMLSMHTGTQREPYHRDAHYQGTVTVLCGIEGYRDTLTADGNTRTFSMTARTDVMELYGNENWVKESNGAFSLANAIPAAPGDASAGLCTHAVYQPSAASGATGADDAAGFVGTKLYLYLPTQSLTSVMALKSYLTAQYMLGTPVSVLYVLATPVTSAVEDASMNPLFDFCFPHAHATLIADPAVNWRYPVNLLARIAELQTQPTVASVGFAALPPAEVQTAEL